MTKDEKKEIFLHIIEKWFEDYTGDITTENCIKFYHHFLDNLEFELNFSPEYGPGFHRFLLSIINLLAHFDTHLEKRTNRVFVTQGRAGLIKLSSDFSGIMEKQHLEDFSLILCDIYTMSKQEFFI